MNFWQSLTKTFGIRTRSNHAQFELGQAYRRVFTGNPSRADQQLVLADMAAKAGWNTITPPSVASDELRFNEGRRSVFANIFAHLSLTPDDVTAFENAVRHEIAADQQQQTT